MSYSYLLLANFVNPPASDKRFPANQNECDLRVSKYYSPYGRSLTQKVEVKFIISYLTFRATGKSKTIIWALLVVQTPSCLQQRMFAFTLSM